MYVIGRSSRIRRALLPKTLQTTVYVTGDDGTYQIGEPRRYAILTSGQYSGTTNITLNGKTDAHSNNCVYDLSTGRMWSRYAIASIGPTSDGKLSWTTNGNGEGVFPCVAAANLALLAGYGNWRAPYDDELISLRDMEAPTAVPDTVAFPSLPTSALYWSSTTRPSLTTQAMQLSFTGGNLSVDIKTATALLLLVRGPL